LWHWKHWFHSIHWLLNTEFDTMSMSKIEKIEKLPNVNLNFFIACLNFVLQTLTNNYAFVFTKLLKMRQSVKFENVFFFSCLFLDWKHNFAYLQNSFSMTNTKNDNLINSIFFQCRYWKNIFYIILLNRKWKPNRLSYRLATRANEEISSLTT